MTEVRKTVIDCHSENQRIDNYLAKQLKKLPRSRIHSMIRKGEVRVDGHRVQHSYKLQLGESVRIPPVNGIRPQPAKSLPSKVILEKLFESDAFLAINKPAGMACHAGSGINQGVIEILRSRGDYADYLELVHRLDRATSGCLLLAKNRSALRQLQAMLVAGKQGISKTYLALLIGRWELGEYTNHSPLSSDIPRDKTIQSATTIFSLEQQYAEYCLMNVRIITGRKHQIRRHAAQMGLPIAGDDKHGNYKENKQLRKQGLKRMFLHAHRLVVNFPDCPALTISAPLPAQLQTFLTHLNTIQASHAY